MHNSQGISRGTESGTQGGIDCWKNTDLTSAESTYGAVLTVLWQEWICCHQKRLHLQPGSEVHQEILALAGC